MPEMSNSNMQVVHLHPGSIYVCSRVGLLFVLRELMTCLKKKQASGRPMHFVAVGDSRMRQLFVQFVNYIDPSLKEVYDGQYNRNRTLGSLDAHFVSTLQLLFAFVCILVQQTLQTLPLSCSELRKPLKIVNRKYVG